MSKTVVITFRNETTSKTRLLIQPASWAFIEEKDERLINIQEYETDSVEVNLEHNDERVQTEFEI